jgi:hypothetical protein
VGEVDEGDEEGAIEDRVEVFVVVTRRGARSSCKASAIAMSSLLEVSKVPLSGS